MLAVDGGSHLAAITRILEGSFPRHAPRPAADDERRTSTSEDSATRSESPETEPTVLSQGPFAGLAQHMGGALQQFQGFAAARLPWHRPQLEQ